MREHFAKEENAKVFSHQRPLKEEKLSKEKRYLTKVKYLGRSDWIRTSGHLNPIQVLYQTEPHPESTMLVYTT